MKTRMTNWIDKMFTHAREKEWYETYWAIDIHGTVSKPDYRKDSKEIVYYPWAAETLKELTNRKDIKLIMHTSSYPKEIEKYIKDFEKDGIKFDFINENPDVHNSKGSFGYYEQKFYFNVSLEDKAGFDPYLDWEPILHYLQTTKYRPDPKWSNKYVETYHK